MPRSAARAAGASGAATASELEFQLERGRRRQFLARVGYPDLVLGGKARMQGTLSWNGDPPCSTTRASRGELKLQAEDGQFLEIEPGLGKLISLMNLQALPRRITLDFRDVFSKGFQFDRIDAERARRSAA